MRNPFVMEVLFLGGYANGMRMTVDTMNEKQFVAETPQIPSIMATREIHPHEPMEYPTHTYLRKILRSGNAENCIYLWDAMPDEIIHEILIDGYRATDN